MVEQLALNQLVEGSNPSGPISSNYYFMLILLVIQYIYMKTRATFVLDEELLIELKKIAIDERKSYSEALEELIQLKVNGTIKNRKVRKR